MPAHRAATSGFCLLGLVLSGCASPVARRPASPVAGEQGGAWEVVMAGGLSGPTLATGPETSRRDESLNYRDAGTLAAAAWPEPDRPSLDHARRLFISERANEVLYFRSGRFYHGYGARRWR